MRRWRFWCPWHLKLRTVFLLIGLVSLVLILFSFFMAQELRQVRGALGKLHPARLGIHLFGRGQEEEEEEEEFVFMRLKRQWKEPQWQVADVLRCPPAMKPQVVPVFIVEEHYEVLKYWFDAVDTGVIPKSGNTLLHIDGHSDAAPPRDLSIMPWFRLPRNHSEVANMMQSNDAFIAGAALGGLINRYIWVWPEWDRAEHADEHDHQVNEVIAGWRSYYPGSAKPFQRLCACIRTRLPNSTEFDKWECWDDEPDPSEMGHGPVIKSKKCKVVLTAVMESVHENKALELLKRGEWIQKDEKILLDIDEDYYGCESSVMPLYNAGLTQTTVDKLSDIVKKFVCANDVVSEFIADKVFHTVVQIVHDFKTSVCGSAASKGMNKCLSEFEADKALIQMIPKITHTLVKAGQKKLLCNGRAAEVMLQILLRLMFSFSTEQLDALNYVGVCLPTAPTNMMFEPDALHICHGFNIPGDTEVTFHVPTAEENDRRSEILRKSLSHLPTEPVVVTLCRSVRDGYTPWAYFSRIERSVLEVLQSVFHGVSEQSFHYDENLLGGKSGWPERYQQ